MLLGKGQKIHVIMRRFFENDLRRHFVGEVLASSDQAALLEGYIYVFVQGVNQYVRKGTKRHRVTSLVDASNIINLIPIEVDIEELNYKIIDNKLVVTDDKLFSMDINEFGGMR